MEGWDFPPTLQLLLFTDYKSTTSRLPSPLPPRPMGVGRSVGVSLGESHPVPRSEDVHELTRGRTKTGSKTLCRVRYTVQEAGVLLCQNTPLSITYPFDHVFTRPSYVTGLSPRRILSPSSFRSHSYTWISLSFFCRCTA